MNKNKSIQKMYRQYIANTYNRHDLVIERGEGAECYDFDGRRFLDFTSGIGVNSLGYANNEWASVVDEQMKTIQNTSNLYYTEPAAKVASEMCQRTGMKKMFFCNSGAEANECAIKTARKYSFEKYGSNRYEIITLTGSFHGRTMATLTATGQDSFHRFYKPLLDGFVYCQGNDIELLKDKITDKTCAIMVELIQGEGGINVLENDYVARLADICREKDILLIVDEVQTGIGRTGEFMAKDHYGLSPDIITVAKGLGAGLPIGGALFGKNTENVLLPGDHGSTFGGNPAVCAGACFVLDVIDSDFLNDVKRKGDYIMSELRKCKNISDVTGKGLMIGFRPDNMDVDEMIKRSYERGLLILKATEKVRLLPPLNIQMPLIEEGVEIIKSAITQM